MEALFVLDKSGKSAKVGTRRFTGWQVLTPPTALKPVTGIDTSEILMQRLF
jgi:hypothetical protein